MKKLASIQRLIKASKTILISGHINPDGDCIGSLLALGLGLRHFKKDVSMYIQGSVPRVYRFLPGVGELTHTLRKTYDLAIAVDCNTKEMLGRARSGFQGAKNIIEIDHHEYRRPFGTVSWVDPKSSCVGEMVFRLLQSLRVEVTPEIATNILTSLLIESGSFRFPSVDAASFSLAARLMKLGVDYYDVVAHLFMSRHRQSALLTGICLSRCKFRANNKIVWSLIRGADFKAAHGKDEDVDPVPDEMRSIQGVRLAILFREKGRSQLRVSMRSKRYVNVARVAESFGGGGHNDVAGCIIKNSDVSIEAFLKDAEKYLLRSGKRS
jgi:bifunctional oligoribonuclease and PAP phosphatase NrnA